MNTGNEKAEAGRRVRETGATAVEFALILPLLFAILYGTITYGYAFFLQQQINFAAEQGARAAVAYIAPAGVTTTAARCAVAISAATNALAYMSAAEKAALNAPTCPAPPATGVAGLNNFSVQVQFKFLEMLPAITLPGIGNVPVLPNPLTATATVLE
ncbi:MAG: pilus assembly protein [Nevskia sp.]|nr:pilus assembly protein [Nevskia sp.]